MDAALNYLFLVSGGTAAATLTYIGNLSKDGTSVPVTAFWMLGCFSTALLAVGLLKFSITYQVWMIFRGYRKLVGDYFNDQIPWSALLENDEKNVKRGGWITHLLGWSVWCLIAAGVIIGFVNLQQESNRVRTEKAKSASTEASATSPKGHVEIDGHGKPQPTKQDYNNRGGTQHTTTGTAQKEVNSPAAK